MLHKKNWPRRLPEHVRRRRSLQAFDKTLDFVERQTDANAGALVRASFDRRNPAASALAARHHLDVNSHFNAPGQQLEV